jgi:large subunit ribosomal protein L4e
MFNPTQTWRKWHRKINTNQKRFAVASALAASSLPALVMARGHRIDGVPEVPLVVDNSVESAQKTKKAIEVLKSVGAFDDVVKARDSRKLRRGHGKHRNRRHVSRLGPLVVYNEDHGIVKAFRNLPGVEIVQVSRLNLLQLAPGGHLGRFIVWTQGAFEQLSSIFGSRTRESTQKKGYTLPYNIMNNSDLTRIINSDEIQSKVRAAIKSTKFVARKKNPLTNLGVRTKLNPYALTLRRSETLAQERRAVAKAAALEAARKSGKETKAPGASAEEKKLRKGHRARQDVNYARLTQDDFLLELRKKQAAEKKDEKKEKKPKVKKAPAATDAKKKGGDDDKKGGAGAAAKKPAEEKKKPAAEDKPAPKKAAPEEKKPAADKKPAAAAEEKAAKKPAGDDKKAAGGKKGGDDKKAEGGDNKKAGGKKGGDDKKAEGGDKKAAGGKKGGDDKKAEGGDKKAAGGKKGGDGGEKKAAGGDKKAAGGKKKKGGDDE